MIDTAGFPQKADCTGGMGNVGYAAEARVLPIRVGSKGHWLQQRDTATFNLQVGAESAPMLDSELL